jgi:hypothetical protein
VLLEAGLQAVTVIEKSPVMPASLALEVMQLTLTVNPLIAKLVVVPAPPAQGGVLLITCDVAHSPPLRAAKLACVPATSSADPISWLVEKTAMKLPSPARTTMMKMAMMMAEPDCRQGG